MLSVFLAGTIGVLAGYLGGVWERAILGFIDLFLSLPWLFLLITVRAMLPLNISPIVSVAVTFGLLIVAAVWSGTSLPVALPTAQAKRAAAPEPALLAPPDTSLFDGDPSLPSARLWVAPSASWMFEYYPMRDVRELPDGSCEAVMTYASDDWMTRLVLGFGSAVQVLEPQSLAQRVRDAAEAALAAYKATEQVTEQAAEQA